MCDSRGPLGGTLRSVPAGWGAPLRDVAFTPLLCGERTRGHGHVCSFLLFCGWPFGLFPIATDNLTAEPLSHTPEIDF